MRALFVYRRHAIWLLSCFLVLMASVGRSEVISIEEFLRVSMASKSVTQVYSYDIGEDIKGYESGNGLFAVRTSSSIKIFNSEGEIQTFTPSSRMVIKEFLENKNMFFASTQNENGDYVLGLFKLDGSPIKFYSNPYVLPSPGGEYLYTGCSMLSSGPIYVYDKEDNFNFQIPNRFECQVSAPSDSQLIVLHYQSLSLWNVNTRQKIWESDIPREDYFTDSAFKITYSVKANIIVVRDMIGCHCYDFQGNFLWAQESPGNNRHINMVGVSEEDGNVVITANEGLIKLNIFSRDGGLLSEPEIPLGPDCLFSANVTPGTAEVFPNFIFLPFMANTGEDRKRVTGILYYDDSEWIAGVVEGSWYLLRSSNDECTLIGLKKETRELSAFSINY